MSAETSSTGSGGTSHDLGSFSMDFTDTPTYTVIRYGDLNKADVLGDSDTCAYCRGPYRSTEEVALFVCQHILHKDCAESWKGPCLYDRVPTTHRSFRILSGDTTWGTILHPEQQSSNWLWTQLRENGPAIEEFIRSLAARAETPQKKAELEQFIKDGVEIVQQLLTTDGENPEVLLEQLRAKQDIYLRFASTLVSTPELWDSFACELLIPGIEELIMSEPSIDYPVSYELLLTAPLALLQPLVGETPFAPIVANTLAGVQGMDQRFLPQLQRINAITNSRFFNKHYSAIRSKGTLGRHLYLSRLPESDRARLGALTRGSGETSRDIQRILPRAGKIRAVNQCIVAICMLYLMVIIFCPEIVELFPSSEK